MRPNPQPSERRSREIPIADVVVAVVVAGIAALGGAAAVLEEFDDAPGGVLIGLIMILGAVVPGTAA